MVAGGADGGTTGLGASDSAAEDGKKIFANSDELEDRNSDREYNRPRTKDCSASFKARSSADISSESIDISKLRREEYVEKIRKLALVKQRLSPKNLKFGEKKTKLFHFRVICMI